MKYEENVLYIGNLMEYKDGKAQIDREGIYLIYNKETDKFISFIDAYAPSMDLLNIKPNDKEKVSLLNEIDRNSYSYIPSQIEGSKYIDENSIELLTKNTKKART